MSGEAQGGHFRQTTLRIQPRGRGEHDTAAYPCTLHKMAALPGGPSSATSRPTTPSLPPLHLSDHLAPTHNVPLTCMISFRAHLTLFDTTLSGPLVLLLSVWHNDKESACRHRRHKKCGFDPSLGQEDLLEEEMATHSSVLAWRISMDRGAWWATVQRITKSQISERLSRAHICLSTQKGL